MKKVVIAVVAAGLLSAAGTALAKPGNGQKDTTIRTAALFSASLRVPFSDANRRAVLMPSSYGIAAGKRKEWYNHIQHSIDLSTNFAKKAFKSYSLGHE